MTIATGADVKVIHRMPGHADASMTLNTYADLRRNRLDEVTLRFQRTEIAHYPQPDPKSS